MDANPGGNAPLQFDTAIPRVTPSAVSTAQGAPPARCVSARFPSSTSMSTDSPCARGAGARSHRSRNTTELGSVRLLGFSASAPPSSVPSSITRSSLSRISRLVSSPSRSATCRVGGPQGRRGPRRTTVPGAGAGADIWAVVLGSTPLMFPVFRRGEREGHGETVPASNRPTPPRNQLMEAGACCFFLASRGVPGLVGLGPFPSGLISAAIIAFGMHQAWRMTAAPALRSPVRIGSRPGHPRPPDRRDAGSHTCRRLRACARCSTELPAQALACPACSALVHRERLQELADRATSAAASGDPPRRAHCGRRRADSSRPRRSSIS